MMEWRAVDGVGHVALNLFSAGEVAHMTGLSAEMQRVWRRRGHLPACAAGRATFDANELSAIAIRHDLARFGFAPSDTVEMGRLVAPIVLYFALMASDGAIGLRGGLKRISEIAGRFEHDDRVARQISGVQWPRRYLWSDDPPAIQLVEDAAANLSDERLSAMLVIDLAVIGKKLVTDNPKPLFLIDVTS